MSSGRTAWQEQCPVPCSQAIYDAKIDRFNINNAAGLDDRIIDEIKDEACLLGFSYETLAVYENVETLVVDIPNFLSQIGGNLGLFLGVCVCHL